MDEVIRQLENGEFTQGEYYATLKSGVKIWTASGLPFIKFYPLGGSSFSFIEKWKINHAIKRGRILQATQ